VFEKLISLDCLCIIHKALVRKLQTVSKRDCVYSNHRALVG